MAIISGGQVMPSDGVPVHAFTKAGAPVANDFAGHCRKGSLAVDTDAGALYICTATNGTTTATWALVGPQP